MLSREGIQSNSTCESKSATRRPPAAQIGRVAIWSFPPHSKDVPSSSSMEEPSARRVARSVPRSTSSWVDGPLTISRNVEGEA